MYTIYTVIIKINELKEYKIGEAAEILNVSVATLQRWDREGKLKALRNASNRRYYTQE
ncbi:MAG: helix-turn-helix domain-containing protein [Lactobacillus sp.]